MSRHKGIIAYGTEQDRRRLEVLANLSGKSGSEFIIEMIRTKYQAVLGDVDPEIILKNQC